MTEKIAIIFHYIKLKNKNKKTIDFLQRKVELKDVFLFSLEKPPREK